MPVLAGRKGAEQTEQERRWGSGSLAKSMLVLRGSQGAAQAMAKLTHGAEHRWWMRLASNYALRSKWASSVQSAGVGGAIAPPIPAVQVAASDTITLALSETGAVTQATPIASSDTITIALSETGSVSLTGTSILTDPDFNLAPGYP